MPTPKTVTPVAALVALQLFAFIAIGVAAEPDPAALLAAIDKKMGALKNYSSVGKMKIQMDTNGMKIDMTCDYKTKMSRDGHYLITWGQNMPMIGVQKGAVWNDGKVAHLYLGMNNSYAEMENELALQTAAGISSGATATTPLLFYQMDGSPQSFTHLTSPKLEASERVGDVDCHVITGSSKVSDSHKVWINKKTGLLVKHQLALGKAQKLDMSDEDLDKAIRAMGKEPNEETRASTRATMKMAQSMSANMKGVMSQEISSVDTKTTVTLENCRYALPAGATKTDSLFGNMMQGGFPNMGTPTMPPDGN